MGLIPEMNLVSDVEISKVTNGAVVNEFYQTEKEWLFSCGNILHVHDLVDNVALEAQQAGKFASLYAQNKLPNHAKAIKVTASSDFSYVLPSTIYEVAGNCEIKFRLKSKIIKKTIVVKCKDVILGKKFVLAGVPGEMMKISFDKSGSVEAIDLSIE